jgi:hypothetical protein
MKTKPVLYLLFVICGTSTSNAQPSSQNSLSLCAAPSGLFATSITNNSAIVGWNAVSGAASYTVEYKLNTAKTWTIIPATTTNTYIPGLTPAMLYDWRVKTNCAKGVSSVYARSQFTTDSCFAATPSGLFTTAITTSSATVNWAAVPNAVSYTVEYKLNKGTSWSGISAAATTASVNITGLTPLTLYDWKVRTNCNGGSGGWADAQFTTLNPCATPTGLSTTAITSYSAVLNWAAVSDAINYTVEYKKNSLPVWSIAAMATTATSVAINGLSSSTAYNWRVLSNCAAGSSAYGQVNFTTASIPTCYSSYDATTNGTAAGAAQILMNSDIAGLINPGGDDDYYKFVISTGGAITITLSNLPADYDLRLYSADGHSWFAISENASTNSETISRTLSSGTYYARVYGYNGAYDLNKCYTLKVATATASFNSHDLVVNDINKPAVFPNPANKSVTVNLGELKGPADLLLYNMYGRLVLKQSTSKSNTTIDISTLPSGIYIITIKNNEKETNLKIIKQ